MQRLVALELLRSGRDGTVGGLLDREWLVWRDIGSRGMRRAGALGAMRAFEVAEEFAGGFAACLGVAA